jgi:lysyl oxidase
VPRLPARRVALGLASAALASALLPLPAFAVNDRLPDLRVARLADFRVQTTASGHRLLRFTSMIVNVGRGPLVLRGTRSSTSASQMVVSQRIYTDAGTSWSLRTPAVLRYSGDGHDHWHVQRIVNYELKPRTNLSATPLRGAKVGFCFFDTNAYRLSLPGAPSSRQYAQSLCGTRSSLTASMGLSVGWGDKYPWNFAFQWIDVTGVKGGDYRVCVTADPEDWFAEVEQLNNSVWADVRFTSTGSAVTVLRYGWTRCWP